MLHLHAKLTIHKLQIAEVTSSELNKKYNETIVETVAYHFLVNSEPWNCSSLSLYIANIVLEIYEYSCC